MNKILIVDLALLVVFSVWLVLFLTKNKKNLKREGWIYLYRTKWGKKQIDTFSERHKKLIKALKYPVIIIGFILMITIIMLLISNVGSYLTAPKKTIELTNGAPPIAPLIPYFPQIFGLQSIFPNFYFSYFIIALAIVAIVHEFSHGVFMKTFGVKIKSTGFLFLGPILGAFVEEDKNNFEKKKNSEQMAILGAGVFANLLSAVIFFIILILFFNVSYTPAGYQFSGYARVGINTSDIVSFENYSEHLIQVRTIENNYLIPQEFYEEISENLGSLDGRVMIVYGDYPAIQSELKGAIVSIDGVSITNLKTFEKEISKRRPSDVVFLQTDYKGELNSYEVKLIESPTNSSKGFLGIESFPRVSSSRNLISRILYSILNFKDPNTRYESKISSEVTEFVYYLIWWVALINLFVAMFNMIPLGILDGGRFIYLFFLSITKSDEKSKRIYKFILSTVILIFILLIVGWILAKFLK